MARGVLVPHVMLRTVFLVGSIAGIGCATDSAGDACECGLGLVCYEGACVASDGKSDLPNGTFYEGPHDGEGYKQIALRFRESGHDLTFDPTQLSLVWPLRVAPAALNRFGTPIQMANVAYFHSALDILRADPASNADVVAPVSGTAYVFNTRGHRGYPADDYATVVAIWDRRSHLIVQLMHVFPVPALVLAGEGGVEVEQGDKIGSLAQIQFGSNEVQEMFRHSHVNLIDGDKMLALDPSRYLPYEDHVAPEVKELYVLDASAKKHTLLRTGKLDVIMEMSDRDDHSVRNFEVAAIAHTISIDGMVRHASPRCELDHLIENLGTYATGTTRVLDLGNAADQIAGDWPNSDIGNRDRTFRYALTQLRIVDGRCTVVADAEGFVDVPAAAQSLTVEVTVWDRNGNQVTAERALHRHAQ